MGRKLYFLWSDTDNLGNKVIYRRMKVVMKICLINPPIQGKRMEGYEWSNNSYTMQHLGIGYIAGTLEANHYNIDIIECPGEDI